MKAKETIIFLLVIFHCSYAPPVTKEAGQQDSEIKDDLEEIMEYHRYLQEVVQTLETDPHFRERLEKADEEDVRSGKIAEQLDFVNHNVRTKLDEIKRRELDRLRHLATKQFELTNELDNSQGKVPSKEHVDHGNPHTFEIEDLKKLIKKTTSDLEAADRKRKQQFKEYQMQKEFEKHQKMEAMDDSQKKEYMEKIKQEEDIKKNHKPIHHPGSKQQLEEVWEKQDHMDQQFDPKAFFMMHDVDGNGVWDASEVKALFIKELDKVYGPAGPNKDLHERAEEMERMREHMFQENDKNRDGLIDFNEFMMETQRADFNQDEGWKSIDENQIYTKDEYQEFERRRLEELRYLQQRGLVDDHGRPVPGAEHQIHQAYQQQPQHPQGYQQYQGHPQNQAPPEYAQHQVPVQAYHDYQQYQPGKPQGPPPYPQPQFQGQPQYQGQQQPPQGQYQGQQQPPQAQYQGQQQQPQGPYHGQQQQPQGQYQGQQQSPQGQYQGQQQAPQGQYQGQQQQPQGQYQGQQQQPQGQYQGHQQPPQGQYQGQQQPQYQAQQQPPQAQNQPNANKQPPVNTANQPVQSQGQAQPVQGQAPSTQGQAQPSQGQSQGQAPPAAH